MRRLIVIVIILASIPITFVFVACGGSGSSTRPLMPGSAVIAPSPASAEFVPADSIEPAPLAPSSSSSP